MDWYLLAIISVIASSLTGIIRKKLVIKEVNSIQTIIIFQLLCALVIFFPAIYFGFEMPPISEYPINFILQGILWGSSSIFLFLAYKKLEASEVAILMAIETLIAVLLGIFILGETFTLRMQIGAILIFSAITIIAFNSFKRIKLNKTFLYIILASVLAGFAVVNDTFLIKQSDSLSFLTIAYLLPGIFVYLYYILKNKCFKFNLNKINLKYTFILSACSIAAGIPFYFALNLDGQISQVILINKSSIILSVLLAAIILKERDHLLKKMFSAILVILGVILLGK